MLTMPPMRINFGLCRDSSCMARCQACGATIGKRPSMISNSANAVIKSGTLRPAPYYSGAGSSVPKYSKKLDVGFSTITSFWAPKELP